MVRKLTRASRRFFLETPHGFSPTPLAAKRGVLHVATLRSAAKIDTLAREFREHRTTFVRGNSGDAIEAVPILKPEYAESCIFEPDAFEIDVDALLQGYLRGIRSRGRQFMPNNEVTTMVQESSGWLLTTPQSALRCRIVINASGAWADDVAKCAGMVPIGVTPLRRTVIVVDAPTDTGISDWPLVLDADETFYFKPYGSCILHSLCDETASAPMDAFPSEYDIALAADRMETVTTVSINRIRSQWAGLRTFTPDRSFAVGFDRHRAGFFWCVGQGGYGIQTAPALASLSAGLITRAQMPTELQKVGIDLKDLDPNRFLS